MKITLCSSIFNPKTRCIICGKLFLHCEKTSIIHFDFFENLFINKPAIADYHKYPTDCNNDWFSNIDELKEIISKITGWK